jgi:hypothetical protein
MNYDRICLMLPTYKRSKTYLPQFIDSAIAMSNPRKICFAFCVNENDQETRNYLLHKDFNGIDIVLVSENLSKPSLAKYFNMLYEAVMKFGENCVVSMLGDDMVFKTNGWDQRILDLINMYEGVGVFWCNDDYIAHERCPVNLFVTQKMVKATGKPFMCEEFGADYIDYLWGKVGKYTATSHYLPDVIIWHNHSTNKPPEQRDPTFQRLSKVQDEAKQLGKKRCKEIAAEIAETLRSKGFVGDSI